MRMEDVWMIILVLLSIDSGKDVYKVTIQARSTISW